MHKQRIRPTTRENCYMSSSSRRKMRQMTFLVRTLSCRVYKLWQRRLCGVDENHSILTILGQLSNTLSKPKSNLLLCKYLQCSFAFEAPRIIYPYPPQHHMLHCVLRTTECAVRHHVNRGYVPIANGVPSALQKLDFNKVDLVKG